eukprot:CAMPEP_0185518830 /NCGR_PEP_ID=MMETSP1366-20130426/72835_1 /TAXON_ID=38817 /ORGANISM="Gephyrocapsa oceanica, Strain RCC1303" /LENGTH=267 /DNA_ID=CAMNT_0028129871 /DNA_START=140 /DNA_END=940 /DNA_ORIENTATION=-
MVVHERLNTPVSSPNAFLATPTAITSALPPRRRLLLHRARADAARQPQPPDVVHAVPADVGSEAGSELAVKGVELERVARVARDVDAVAAAPLLLRRVRLRDEDDGLHLTAAHRGEVAGECLDGERVGGDAWDLEGDAELGEHLAHPLHGPLEPSFRRHLPAESADGHAAASRRGGARVRPRPQRGDVGRHLARQLRLGRVEHRQRPLRAALPFLGARLEGRRVRVQRQRLERGARHAVRADDGRGRGGRVARAEALRPRGDEAILR